MSGLLEDKVGLVTGAAGGIGRATALACAREGAAVVVSDLAQAQDGGGETVRSTEESGGVDQQGPFTRRGSGAIVNTSSLAGLVSNSRLGAYVPSRHGVIGLTKSAAVECGEQAIRAVCPAAIPTPNDGTARAPVQEELMAPRAMKRFGETNEAAEAVVWPCSDRSSFVSGIAMDGATSF